MNYNPIAQIAQVHKISFNRSVPGGLTHRPVEYAFLSSQKCSLEFLSRGTELDRLESRRNRNLIASLPCFQEFLVLKGAAVGLAGSSYNHCRYRKCPQATSDSAQIFTTNFLVLFTKIKVFQEILKLYYSYDWIKQLFYFLTVQVWCLGGFPEACDRGVSRGPLK